MSYISNESASVVFGAGSGINTHSITNPTTFNFENAVGACSIVNNNVICDHVASTATVDISSYSSGGGNYNIFGYGFENGTYYTASHVRNAYEKGDDAGWGVFRTNNLTVKTSAVMYAINGTHNYEQLNQLGGVVI